MFSRRSVLLLEVTTTKTIRNYVEVTKPPIVFLLVFLFGVLGSAYTGLSERVFLAFPFAWIVVMGVALYRSELKKEHV
jgi:heme O synthase-like polyprenyltransferase